VLDQGVTEDEAPPASPELLPIAEGQPVADARSNAEDAPAERVGQVTAGLPDRAPMPDADKIVDAVDDADTGDDEEPVQPVQAYRDRASYTPERYLLVRPLSEENGVLNPEVVERVTSVLRQRSPSLAEPQPAS
jgi:hypothetical protein